MPHLSKNEKTCNGLRKWEILIARLPGNGVKIQLRSMTAKTVFRMFLRSCLLLAVASGSGAGGSYRATGAVLSDLGASSPTNLQFPGVPPFVLLVDPANGASGVSVNSPIKFTFTTAMSTGNRVAWSANVNTADLVCTQSADKTDLTCTTTTGWLVVVITWDISAFQAAD